MGIERLKKETIPQIFLDSCRKWSSRPAYSVKHRGRWEDLSYGQVYSLAKETATALWKLGFRRGDVMAILSENRPEWNICDFAISGAGMVSVPVYPTLTSEQILYILDHSEAGLIFVSSAEQARKIMDIQQTLPKLKYMIVFDENGMPQNQDWILGFDAFRALSEKEAAAFVYDFDAECDKSEEDDIFTIIYTSGTTGVPKGVILSQRNVASNVESALKALSIDEQDVFLSFLPLSHSLERMAGHVAPFRAGSRVAFAEGVNEVQDNLLEIGPTVVISVPRLFEKIYSKIQLGLSSSSAPKKKVFSWAVKVGSRISSSCSQFGRHPRGFLALKGRIAFQLVFKKLSRALGGNIRYFVSGGAPLSRDIGEFFDAAGIPVLEGYGLTETSPVTNVNRLERYKFGTVGPAIEGVEISLSDEQEIWVKGPNVMKGYFRDAAATEEAFSEDGWLRTGDLGEIDEDGYLKITGRIKDIIVTSGGKNIAPARTEQALSQSPYISQVVIIGDRRSYLTALIVPNLDEIRQLAADKQIQYDSDEQLVHHFEILGFIEKEVEAQQQNLARFEQIKKFTLMSREFSIEEGEMTPSLKIRRAMVENKYSDIIDIMYS